MADPVLQVVDVECALLDPNPWNPNRMSARQRAKLVAYLREQGLVSPLVVRPSPMAPGRWQILNGEHRWGVWWRDLGRPVIPCSVVHVDDRQARIITINLNELSGEPVPHLLAGLLEELAREAPPRDLAGVLPYDEAELMDRIAVGRALPLIEERVEAQARAQHATAPVQFAFMVPAEHAAAVRGALERAAASLPGGKNGQGRALALVCEAYLAPHAPQSAEIRRDGADPT